MAAEFVAQVLPDNVSASEAMRVDDATYMARIGLAQPVVETPAAETPKPEEKPVEETKLLVEVSTETPAEVPAEKPAEEGTVEEKPVEEEKPEEELPPLLTKFTVKDDEGELEIPRNLKFDFKANGKDYENLPLDKVILFAQQGIYNHEKQQQVEAMVQQAQQIALQAQQSEQKATQLEQYYEQLFDDPEFYERARNEFLRDRTPEAQLAQTRQQLAFRDQQDQQQREASMRTGFVNNVLSPKIKALLEENPTVNQDELIGRYTIMTAPMLVRGQIPVERLPDVQALAENQLTHWVRSVHLERSAEATKKSKQVKDAEAAVMVAKRSVARVSSAAGATGSAPQVAKVNPNESAQEWFNRTFKTAG